MTIDSEDRRKQSLELFIKAIAAAPDSFIKTLTGKEYAAHMTDGAKIIEDYLYPKENSKNPRA